MNPIPPSNSPPINKPVNLVFVGPIQNPAVKNLRNVCCNTITTGTREIQILFSSGGGAVDEGFALYTFLRALPVKLTMHAIGNVDSIALVVFLAGEHRFCSPNATFLFHDFAWGTNGAINQTRSQWADVHALLERMKTQSQDLLKLRTALTNKGQSKSLSFTISPASKALALPRKKGSFRRSRMSAYPLVRLSPISTSDDGSNRLAPLGTWMGFIQPAVSADGHSVSRVFFSKLFTFHPYVN